MKASKYELISYKVEAMDKIVEDLKDTASWHNGEVLHQYVNKLRGKSQSGVVPVRDRNGVTISDRERAKERWTECLKIC